MGRVLEGSYSSDPAGLGQGPNVHCLPEAAVLGGKLLKPNYSHTAIANGMSSVSICDVEETLYSVL